MAKSSPRSNPRVLAKKLGLRIAVTEMLTIRRERNGETWVYIGRNKRRIAARMCKRFDRLAVPPAYTDVRYARDPKAHIQAIGRDAAGRLQYVYHPDWTKIREIRKAERLSALVDVMPRIRRALTQRLNDAEVTREFALAAVIELIATSAIRAGGEEYARERKTRGAATLLKSNVKCEDGTIHLSFRAKGGKHIKKSLENARLAGAIERLRDLQGSRLFQYEDADGATRTVTATEVNAYLKEIAGCEVTLKDFRTLCATGEVLQTLAAVEPAESAHGRKKQIKEALKAAARTLENTVTVCRQSYVHPAVITAFEAGELKQFADHLKAARSPARVETVVAELIEAAE